MTEGPETGSTGSSTGSSIGARAGVAFLLGVVFIWLGLSWITAEFDPALRLAVFVAAGTAALLGEQIWKSRFSYWLALLTILIAGALQAYTAYVVGSGAGEQLGRNLAFAWVGASILFSVTDQFASGRKSVANNATSLAVGNIILLLALSPVFCPR